jgi:ribosomal protein S18 acetylase RimI-like enzyme
MGELYSIDVQDVLDPHDERVIEDGLTAFNVQYAPPENYQRLVVLLRAADHRIVGGIIGNTWWGWLRIDTLWVDEAARHEGWGTRLMQAAEEEAVRRGCHHVFLDTMSFQALPFYLKLGYTVFGQLDDLPVGHSRYFLQKTLQPVAF